MKENKTSLSEIAVCTIVMLFLTRHNFSLNSQRNIPVHKKGNKIKSENLSRKRSMMEVTSIDQKRLMARCTDFDTGF
jgi:hypothetical protein